MKLRVECKLGVELASNRKAFRCDWRTEVAGGFSGHECRCLVFGVWCLVFVFVCMMKLNSIFFTVISHVSEDVI